MNDAMLAAGSAALSNNSKVWTARMVRPLSDKGVGTRASFLRKTFTLSSLEGAGTLTISALGLYRAFINGKRVGHDQLTPGWTVYTQRLSYQTYDVSDLLVAGENTIDIWLGDGWMRSQMSWAANPIFNTWGADVGAIAELRRGNEVLVETDTSWSSGLLPILKSGIYFGEIYDAREETLVADQGTALVTDFDTGRLIPHEIDPVQELEPLPVVSSVKDAEGRTIYDFGQNSGGYVAFTVKGDRGAKVVVEHCRDSRQGWPVLQSEPALGRMPPGIYPQGRRRGELPTHLHLPGLPLRPYQHRGQRRGHVDRLGARSPRRSIPRPRSLRPVRSSTGWCRTRSGAQRANFIEVPTDCPQRDERLGWTGDIQVFAPTACYLNGSHDFLAKWLRDLMADQRPDGGISHVSPDPFRNQGDGPYYGSTGWGDAIAIVPWVLYTHYGDRGILEECFDAMVRWNDFVWSISDGPIVHPPSGWEGRGFTFGDWLQPQGDFAKPYPTIGDDAAATIYLYISSDLIARVAETIGKTDEAKRLRERAEDVKKAFQKEFITASGRIGYNDQTSYALAFLHDLIPAHHIEAAKGYFKETVERAKRRIGTGFIGTPALLPALIKIGEPELAAAVFLQEDVPGWLYQVKTRCHHHLGALGRDPGRWLDLQPADELLQSLRLWRGVPVAVRSRRRLPPRPGDAGLQAHHLRADDHSGALTGGGGSRLRGGTRSRRDGQSRATRSTYDIVVPEGASGTLVLSPDYRDIVVDGMQLNWSGTEKARSLLAPGRHSVTFRISGTGN